MATVTSTQAAQITALFPKLSASDAAKATVGALTTQTITSNVPTTVTIKHRKVIMPNGQVISISE
jgi:hypothetical protein